VVRGRKTSGEEWLSGCGVGGGGGLGGTRTRGSWILCSWRASQRGGLKKVVRCWSLEVRRRSSGTADCRTSKNRKPPFLGLESLRLKLLSLRGTEHPLKSRTEHNQQPAAQITQSLCPMNAQLDALPTELLLAVAKYLESVDLSRAVRANRRLQAVLSPQLYSWRLLLYVKYCTTFDESFAAKFLSSGAGINWQNPLGKTALHLAANSDKVAAVSFLLARGASMAAKDHEGRTALFDARSRRMVVLLLEKGAEINTKAARLQTALHVASEFGRWEVTELLLEHGAEIDGQDVCGQTALHWAAYYGQKRCCRMLLEKGANLLVQDEYKLNALDYARIMGGHKTLIPLIEGYLRRPTT